MENEGWVEYEPKIIGRGMARNPERRFWQLWKPRYVSEALKPQGKSFYKTDGKNVTFRLEVDTLPEGSAE